MSIYVAKAVGFGLAMHAKKAGVCHKSLLRFKIAEIMVLILADISLSILAV